MDGAVSTIRLADPQGTGKILREKGEKIMTRVPDAELVRVPGGTLITATAEEGRALATTMARHSIQFTTSNPTSTFW
jgi:hypothetical protein